MADEKQLDNFNRLQAQLGSMLKRVPPNSTRWSYQRTVEFKKAAEESGRFLKLKPTDDAAAAHRIEVQIYKVKKFYEV